MQTDMLREWDFAMRMWTSAGFPPTLQELDDFDDLNDFVSGKK